MYIHLHIGCISGGYRYQNQVSILFDTSFRYQNQVSILFDTSWWYQNQVSILFDTSRYRYQYRYLVSIPAILNITKLEICPVNIDWPRVFIHIYVLFWKTYILASFWRNPKIFRNFRAIFGKSVLGIDTRIRYRYFSIPHVDTKIRYRYLVAIPKSGIDTFWYL